VVSGSTGLGIKEGKLGVEGRKAGGCHARMSSTSILGPSRSAFYKLGARSLLCLVALVKIVAALNINHAAFFGTQQGSSIQLVDNTPKQPKYLAYAYNSGRLNNQMESIAAHFRIAKALGRTLVFPVRPGV
jgi:hypothetical protein